MVTYFQILGEEKVNIYKRKQRAGNSWWENGDILKQKNAVCCGTMWVQVGAMAGSIWHPFNKKLFCSKYQPFNKKCKKSIVVISCPSLA